MQNRLLRARDWDVEKAATLWDEILAYRLVLCVYGNVCIWHVEKAATLWDEILAYRLAYLYQKMSICACECMYSNKKKFSVCVNARVICMYMSCLF